MTSFSSRSTAEQVATHFADRCKGKHVIVTGGNAGLGLETARVLASKGAIVTIGSRTIANGEEAIAKIKSKQPDAKVSVLALDLASLKSVKAFAEQYLARNEPLNILINNAGVMACDRIMTEEGLETQFGVNHIGHFYLTELLLKKLEESGTREEPSRVIALSSVALYLFGFDEGIRFDDLSADKTYSRWERYGQSKLANLLFARELTKRMQERNVIAVSLHPGAIPGTNLSRYMSARAMMEFLSSFRKGGFWAIATSVPKSIEQGSSTTLYAALNPDIVPGEYYSDCHVEKFQVHPKASDDELARKLWDYSEDFVKSKMG